MRSFAPGTSLIDLLFMGHAEYIACYVLETAGGLALVDPGITHGRHKLTPRISSHRVAGIHEDLVFGGLNQGIARQVL